MYLIVKAKDKQAYDEPKIEVYQFDSADVITTSGDSSGNGSGKWTGEWDSEL